MSGWLNIIFINVSGDTSHYNHNQCNENQNHHIVLLDPFPQRRPISIAIAIAHYSFFFLFFPFKRKKKNVAEFSVENGLSHLVAFPLRENLSIRQTVLLSSQQSRTSQTCSIYPVANGFTHSCGTYTRLWSRICCRPLGRTKHLGSAYRKHCLSIF